MAWWRLTNPARLTTGRRFQNKLGFCSLCYIWTINHWQTFVYTDNISIKDTTELTLRWSHRLFKVPISTSVGVCVCLCVVTEMSQQVCNPIWQCAARKVTLVTVFSPFSPLVALPCPRSHLLSPPSTCPDDFPLLFVSMFPFPLSPPSLIFLWLFPLLQDGGGRWWWGGAEWLGRPRWTYSRWPGIKVGAEGERKWKWQTMMVEWLCFATGTAPLHL